MAREALEPGEIAAYYFGKSRFRKWCFLLILFDENTQEKVGMNSIYLLSLIFYLFSDIELSEVDFLSHIARESTKRPCSCGGR